MPGCSNVAVIVYDCTSEDVPAIFDVFARHGLRDGHHGDEVHHTDGRIRLGHLYGDSEVYASASGFIAADLYRAAPGATFQVWTDPDGEGLGRLVVFVPHLGAFTAECDAGGDSVFRGAALLSPAQGGYASLLAHLGVPWFEQLDRLTAALPLPAQEPRVVEAPDPHPLAGLDEGEREGLAHELNVMLHGATTGQG